MPIRHTFSKKRLNGGTSGFFKFYKNCIFKVQFFVNIKCQKQITVEELKVVRFNKNHRKKVFSLHRTKFSENSDFLVNQ